MVTGLLADLAARGLSGDGGLLAALDGAKALAAGVKKVFGDNAQIQRCTLHKRRNVKGHLPKELGSKIDWRLARAFAEGDPAKGLDQVKRIAGELKADHPDAPRRLDRRRRSRPHPHPVPQPGTAPTGNSNVPDNKTPPAEEPVPSAHQPSHPPTTSPVHPTEPSPPATPPRKSHQPTSRSCRTDNDDTSTVVLQLHNRTTTTPTPISAVRNQPERQSGINRNSCPQSPEYARDLVDTR